MEKNSNGSFSFFRFTISFSLLVFLSRFSFAQTEIKLDKPGNGLLIELAEKIEKAYSENYNYRFHPSLKPYSLRDAAKCGLAGHVSDSSFNIKKSSISFHPLIDCYTGFDFLKSNLITETNSGLTIFGKMSNSFSFSLSGVGGMSQFPNFTDTLIKEYGIIPGNGIAYRNSDTLKSAAFYSYSNFFGSLVWSPQPYFQMELGKDKMFLGDGYRSLLLSDISNNYPFLKTSFTFWRFKYSFWCSWFRDVSQSNGFSNEFLNKYGSFHYLSYNVNKRLSISLFENIIWQGTDSNRVRSFDVNYLSPFVFFRPVEYSIGSSDNAMMGLNLSFKPLRNLKIYSQLILDEFLLKEIRARKGWWANKQGVQSGILYFDAFGVDGLTIRSEFNTVRPYTYSHGSPQQNYTHFNQPLAHPFGANFKELLSNFSYEKKRFRLDVKALYAEIGKDTSGVTSSNVGQNIFLSYLSRPYDYGHKTGQGIKTTFMQAEVKLSYLIIPKIALRCDFGIIQRSFSNIRGFRQETPFVYLGIRTAFYNRYRDY